MNVRKAQKHIQRATELLNPESQLGFGVGETSELGKRPREEDELVPGFARQIGPTCYLNAVFNVIFKCLHDDEKLWEKNLKLFEFLQELYFSNKSIQVEQALQNVGGEFVKDRSVQSLQQSGTRNLFGKDFNKIFFKVNNALYGRKESIHSRINWENRKIYFTSRSATFLFVLILFAYSELTFIWKPDFNMFRIDNVYLRRNGEVIIKSADVRSEEKVIERLKYKEYPSRYIFCMETHQDRGHADEFQTCFLNHSWLMEELPMRFAGSIVKLSKRPGVVGSTGHALVAYPVSTPFTPGTDIMVCNSDGKPCKMSDNLEIVSMQRTIDEVLFIYRPTKYR